MHPDRTTSAIVAAWERQRGQLSPQQLAHPLVQLLEPHALAGLDERRALIWHAALSVTESPREVEALLTGIVTAAPELASWIEEALDSVVGSLEQPPIPQDAMQTNARSVAAALARVPPGGVLVPFAAGLAAGVPLILVLMRTSLPPVVAKVLCGLVSLAVAGAVWKWQTSREYARTVRRALLDAGWSNPAPLSLVASELRLRADQVAQSSTESNAARFRKFANESEQDPIVRAWFAAVWLARAAATNRATLQPAGPAMPFRGGTPE